MIAATATASLGDDTMVGVSVVTMVECNESF